MGGVHLCSILEQAKKKELHEESGWACARGPKDRVSIRISHTGSKAPYKGDTRKHAYVHVVCWGPMYGPGSLSEGFAQG